jgi:(5-formylfuran-3-yl)methyl phosphate synthase
MPGYGGLCSTRSHDRSIPRREGGGRPRAPVLLASARDPDEAAAAARGGAGIVDLKDPALGVLGPCDDAVLAEAARRVAGVAPGLPLSAALGALRDRNVERRAAVAARLGFTYLKAGLDGIGDPSRAVAWLRRVARAADGARPGARLIAASFADAETIGALDPALLPAAAATAGCAGCLLDTAIKDGRGVLDHLGPAGVTRFVRACRERGLLAAVAGSITPGDLPILVATRPDVIGARGALCSGGREGRLDPLRLGTFRDALRNATASPAARA